MKIRLLDYGGRCPERAHANDAGADVFSPRDAVIRPGRNLQDTFGIWTFGS